MSFYKIADFATLVGKHTNTVDNWFKLLEEKRLHYVSRVNSEKVYDNDDLEIALFIRDRRTEKWSLEGICHELPEKFQLRPFPPNMEEPSLPFDIEQFRKEVSVSLQKEVEQIRDDIKKQVFEQMTLQLQSHELKHLQRQQRMEDVLTRRKVERILKSEALHMWYTKPESERMKRTFFKKEEDREKKEQFIESYIDDHFEERLRQQYDY